MTTPNDIRADLVRILNRDLIGPGPGPSDADLASEILAERPSRWYLTGYLVPLDAPDDQREGSAQSEGELDSGADGGGLDDADEPDHGAARKAFLPSSMGLSVLVDEETPELEVEITWGDYRRQQAESSSEGGDDGRSDVETDDPDSLPDEEGRAETEGTEQAGGRRRFRSVHWRREPRREVLSIALADGDVSYVKVPSSDGLQIAVLSRTTTIQSDTGPRPARAVSLFLVNHRAALNDRKRADEAFAFQVRLDVRAKRAFLPRPDIHGMNSEDWDQRVGDLHYRDCMELAVGHNASVDWDETGENGCGHVWTTWFPLAPVPRVIPAAAVGCELGMEILGVLTDATDAHSRLAGMVAAYRDWITGQRAGLGSLVARRREVADELLSRAEQAAQRIEDGIGCFNDPVVLDAFRTANRAIAASARRRQSQEDGIPLAATRVPRWRPFQLAFILLNLKGLAESGHIDRETVDLLFFPTGGGKTEAYLGLAAFTIALRRLRNPGLAGAGLTVLMRYTLRLLTLDQLGRAAAMICALELERRAGTANLGDWPIEIGLWVGRAATPNRMGHKKDSNPESARSRVLRFINNTRNPQPLPIEQCPWCGTRFDRDSFRLRPNSDTPTTLDLHCVNRQCEFHLSRIPLPIQAVDDPIYRRLPAFMIATVDKFAAMPWTGEVSSFFGGADRYDASGFYGPAVPGAGARLSHPLLPLDLVIQDELHLISGPLGTMVGLYETALDTLSARTVGEKTIRPKIVASTATVRQADRQVRALFDRRTVHIFPPPGPDRRDSFFAQMLPEDEAGARHYLGIAAPGGSPKVIFLRVMVSLMAAAQKLWDAAGATSPNPSDAYMSVVAYFNALRELGGARRIVEGEIGPRLEKYSRRRRVGEVDPPFADRHIQYEPVELTSRVPMGDVAQFKRRLAEPFSNTADHVDVALATNMISVGLDITRLGLMVVSGQPKTTSEYIQATSRVGRNPDRPGLIIPLLNINKPRDRSHYERFKAWHRSFYRGVEATSVTPFSPRALDRGLAAVTVAMSRLSRAPLTPQLGAQNVGAWRTQLDSVVDAIMTRAGRHRDLDSAARANLEAVVRGRTADLLDEWTSMAANIGGLGGRFGYDEHGNIQPLLREMLDSRPLTDAQRKFRAPRSLRDVEPNVLVAIQSPSGGDIDIDTGSGS